MANWVTIDQVQAHLGVQQDPRMVVCLAAAQAWAARTRPDLDPNVVPHDDVQYATVLYAATLYRTRTSLQGVAQYDTMMQLDDPMAWATIMTLIGVRKPVAR